MHITPFYASTGFKMSLKHFMKDDQLLVLTIHGPDGMEAIAPFLIRKQRYDGLPVRKVELIGMFTRDSYYSL